MAAATWWSLDLGAMTSLDTRFALGLILVMYGLWGLRKPMLPSISSANRWAGLAAGMATGVLTASTAIFVLPLVPYLQALRLDKATMVQALGLSFTVATVALALRLGAFEATSVVTISSAWALVAALSGMAVGARVRSRISADTFQRSVFMVFIALGAANLWKAV